MMTDETREQKARELVISENKLLKSENAHLKKVITYLQERSFLREKEGFIAGGLSISPSSPENGDLAKLLQEKYQEYSDRLRAEGR